MNRNPYEAPVQARVADGATGPVGPMYTLAAIGALFASLYWGALTALIALGAFRGTTSSAQVLLPIVLVVLYAMRAFQIFKGSRAAAKRVLWLHGVGGVMALVQMFSGGAILAALQGVKVLIHIFGGVTAYLAQRQA